MTAHRSIRRRLLTLLIFTILLVWLVVLLLVYRSAGHEVKEVFDADLARSARILQALLLHEVEEEHEMSSRVHEVMDELGTEGMRRYPKLAATLRDYLIEEVAEEANERIEIVNSARQAGHRYGAGLVFVARYRDGSVVMRDGSAPEIPVAGDGFADMQLSGEPWRTYSLTEPGTGLMVQVGERHAFRRELVTHITRNTLMPLLLALPILGLLIWLAVGHALAPLQRIASEVSMREPDVLDPIDDQDAPREIHGLVISLNKLFTRLGAAIRRERQFTADAAHELRTPLAALKAHLQVAHARSSEPSTRDSLDQALEGVDRATHSVEQLLILARADAEQTQALLNTPVDLSAVASAVVSALSQAAVDRDIDLGLEAPHGLTVHGDVTSLQLMLRNLVDNAVRYTQAGGMVTVATGSGAGSVWVAVSDNGVGVPPAERQKIFDRFHRGANEQAVGVSGSGLGLAIVRQIAELHGAEVLLDDGPKGRGLSVRVIFPDT